MIDEIDESNALERSKHSISYSLLLRTIQEGTKIDDTDSASLTYLDVTGHITAGKIERDVSSDSVGTGVL